MTSRMTNRKQPNKKPNTNNEADSSKCAKSPTPINEEESFSSDPNDDDDYVHLIPRRRRYKKSRNDWSIPFDLRELTSPSARDEIITTASKFAGTRISRSGMYVRPSWNDVIQNYIPGRRMCLLFVSIFSFVVFSGLKVVEMMNHEEARNYRSGYAPYEYDSFRSVAGMSLDEVEHWCLLVDDHNCECVNPLKPLRNNTALWTKAMDLNVELIRNVTSDLDVVLLGDSVVEQWNGREMGIEKDYLSEIKNKFNRMFRKDYGGLVEGLALGIAGDISSNLLYRIQNGEMPKSLNPKVWWILIGTNDLALMQCSEEVIIIGIIRVVEEILRRKPDSTVVINGILPRTNRKDGYLVPPTDKKEHTKSIDNTTQFHFWPYIQIINDELKDFSKTHDNVKYVDSSDLFLTQLGNENFKREEKLLAEELMADFIHPSLMGSEIWGESIVKNTLAIIENTSDGYP